MLRQGITKRGEVAEEATGAGDHHDKVRNILQSRRARSANRSASRGGSLSNSGSRILLGIGGSPKKLREISPETQRSDANKNKGVGQHYNNASLLTNDGSDPAKEANNDHGGEAASADHNRESLVTCLRLHPTPPSSAATTTTNTATAPESPRRSHSLSRKLLGRSRRGRSQQPRSSVSSQQTATTATVATTTTTGRSLSPNQHFAAAKINNTAAGPDSPESVASVKIKLFRQAPPPLTTDSNSNNNNPANNERAPREDTTTHQTTKTSSSARGRSRRNDTDGNNDLKSSQASLLSHMSIPSSSLSSMSNKKSKGKTKSMWRKIIMGRNKKKHAVGTNNGTAARHDNNAQSSSVGSPVRNYAPDESSRSGGTATSDPPSPPSAAMINHWGMIPSANNNGDNHHHGSDGHDDDDIIPFSGDDHHDAPWNPTMSLLVATGQLDCIESDSDGELETSSVNMGGEEDDDDDHDGTHSEEGGGKENYERKGSSSSGDEYTNENSCSEGGSGSSHASRRESDLSNSDKYLLSRDMSNSDLTVSPPDGGGSYEQIMNVFDNNGEEEEVVPHMVLDASTKLDTIVDDSPSRSGGGGDDDDPRQSTAAATTTTTTGGRSTPSTTSGGFDPDDFMQSHGFLQGQNNDVMGIDDFCNQVSTSYLRKVSQDNHHNHHNDKNCDESTLSKEDTVGSNISFKGPGKKKGRRGKSSDNNKKHKGNNGENNKEKSRHLSIRSLSQSFVGRRGRSRGRKHQDTTVAGDSTPLPQAEKVKKSSKKKAKNNDEEGGAVSSAQVYPTLAVSSAQDDTNPGETKSSPRRSRSLFRRGHGNILHKSSKKQEETVEPRRGSSLQITNGRHVSQNNDGHASMKQRDAHSLPRKISHTPSTRAASLSGSNSSLEVSDFSISHGKRRHKRRKKCLVCRQKIPRGEPGIQYMDFYFCQGGDCFQCFSCKRRLSQDLANENENNEAEENENKMEQDNGLQIISRARGSIVQCGQCANKTNVMGGMGRSSPRTKSSSFDDSSGLKRSIHMDEEDSSHDGTMMAIMSAEQEESRQQQQQQTSSGGDTASNVDVDCATCLSRAAKRLAEKASIKLTLGSPGEELSSDRQILSTLYFTQNEDDRQKSCRSFRSRQHADSTVENADVNSTKVEYELDSDAFGNPNYDGYYCSINNFDESDHNHDTPRVTTIALPKLESDEIDGAISQQLDIDLHWVDEDGESYNSEDSNTSGRYIRPTRTGPAMLSIEPFKSETITKETVMKVLRQTWEYQGHEENENVTYEVTFVVPFKKIYISWEIDDGDELDLAQCQLEVTVRYDPPLETEEEEPEPTLEPETVTDMGTSITTHNKNLESDAAITDATIHMLPSTVNNDYMPKDVYEDNNEGHENDNIDIDDGNSLDDHSMPNAVYIKKLSLEDSNLSSTGMMNMNPSSSSRRRSIDPDRDENDNFSELLSVASSLDSIIALPSITHLKIEKKDFDEEVGLSLIEKNGSTIVAEVSKSGLFAGTSIKEGCELLAINGQCVRGPRSVMRIMKDSVGKVMIMLSDSPSPPGARFVVKKHKSTGFGSCREAAEDITLETINGLVRVQDIAEDGIFTDSPISKGDICLSVDGVPAVFDDVATRALGRSQSIVAVLMFSLPSFWKNIVELTIDEKYNRWWKKDSVCTLLWGNEDCTPITLTFNEQTGLCSADGNEENEVDLMYTNIIIARVMKLLTESIKAYQSKPKERVRGSSRSLSVSASGKMNNRSDVYRRALIKLDEMRQNGTLSVKDYEAGRHALAQVAIQTAT